MTEFLFLQVKLTFTLNSIKDTVLESDARVHSYSKSSFFFIEHDEYEIAQSTRF